MVVAAAIHESGQVTDERTEQARRLARQGLRRSLLRPVCLGFAAAVGRGWVRTIFHGDSGGLSAVRGCYTFPAYRSGTEDLEE
jgi:hypothetical protein